MAHCIAQKLHADGHKGDYSWGHHILGLPRCRSELSEYDAHVVLVFRGAQFGEHCTSHPMAEFVFRRPPPFLDRGSPFGHMLILTKDGGPGCSSMIGLFQEHGPCHFVDGSDEPSLNEYSWNTGK